MTTLATFLLIFAAGPVAFWALVRHTPERGYFTLLVTVALALVLLASVVPRHAGAAWQAWEYQGVVILVSLWLGWIAVLALCVLALRARLSVGLHIAGPSPSARWPRSCPGSGCIWHKWW